MGSGATKWEIAGPKPIASPAQDRVKLIATPFLRLEMFCTPHFSEASLVKGEYFDHKCLNFNILNME